MRMQTLVATIETVCAILGDNHRVPLPSVMEILQYLATIDNSVEPGQVDMVVRTLMSGNT